MQESVRQEPARTVPVLSAQELSRVRSVLYLNGLRGTEIEDAAQDVQVRLLERAPVDLVSAGSWASVVATRVALDRHRRRATRRRMLLRLASGTEESCATPDAADVVAVRTALEGLDPDLRSVVVLRYFADLDVAAISAALAIPTGTVKSRLSRAHARLRNALSEAQP